MSHPIQKPDLVAPYIVANYYNVDVTSVVVRHINRGFNDDFSLGILSHVNGVLTYLNVQPTGTIPDDNRDYNITAVDVYVPV